VRPAKIQPLPKDYLVVKKEHGADELISRLTSARTALSRNQNGAALELFNSLYEKYPKDSRVLIGRAVAMQRLGKNPEALSAYEEALTNDPKNLEALTNMLGLLNGQDTTLAAEKLQQLAEVYPFNADIAAQLGMAYGASGNYEKSLKYLDMADALKPGNADVLYNRAIVYDKMGKTDKAADLYRQIVSMAGDGSIDQTLPIDAIKTRLAAIR
jgi:Flp pilus assembly protein TadD